MKNEYLLIVARGMGFEASLENEQVRLAKHEYDSDYQDYIFNPSEGELIKWLLERGYVQYLSNSSIDYTLYNHTDTFSFNSVLGDLKENLFNIVLQVIQDDK